MVQQQRNIAAFPIKDSIKALKQQMLDWANQSGICIFLDSNNYEVNGMYECIAAIGNIKNICITTYTGNALQQLQALHNTTRDWLFGHFSYDLKDCLHPKLPASYKPDNGFPLLYFFVPEHVLYIEKGADKLVIETYASPHEVYNAVINTLPQPLKQQKADFTGSIDKDTYLNIICRIQQHIKKGDCYELNYCNHNYCKDANINPLHVFRILNNISPTPFAAYYKLQDNFMMCASPERYLLKKADVITTQPIKGTAPRGATAQEDEHNKYLLQHDIKEKAENVMIVDLSRNDLAHTCIPGSIKVDELFGIYTFPQVHQMISTISGTLQKDRQFTDVIAHSFPMGSMTGAPKYKVMELIGKYEPVSRGLFSGSVGYISPFGNFDFNVVIRSLFYNSNSRYLSYYTGGAITFDSVPKKEWEETRLKATAIEKVFKQH